MLGLARNVIANFGGIGIASAAPLLFNVGYYRILGSEAYGLVGLYVTAQMIAAALDLGLSRTTTREVARYTSKQASGSLVRSTTVILLTLHVALFTLVAAAVALASKWIAHSWLETGQIEASTARLSIILIGVTIAAHQPRVIFLAALNGLQRQVLTNALIAATAIARGVVTLAILWLAPTLHAFFWTQAAMAALETLVIALVIWRALPPSDAPPRPRWSLVRSVARFGLSDGANVAIGTAMLSADKLILSGALSLEAFGTYGMLSLLAQSLARLPAPFTVAYFPHMVALYERGDTAGLAKAYRQASRALSTLLIPAAAVAVAFATPLAAAILKPTGGISQPGAILALLSAAFTAHALMHLPYTLQLTVGWTRLGLVTNVVVFSTYVPLLMLLAPGHGLAIAPWLFLAATLLPLPIFVHLTHRRALPRAARRWWVEALIVPIAISCLVVIPVRLIATPLSSWTAALGGAVAGLVALGLIAQWGRKVASKVEL